jgi:hypothetical protein
VTETLCGVNENGSCCVYLLKEKILYLDRRDIFADPSTTMGMP